MATYDLALYYVLLTHYWLRLAAHFSNKLSNYCYSAYHLLTLRRPLLPATCYLLLTASNSTTCCVELYLLLATCTYYLYVLPALTTSYYLHVGVIRSRCQRSGGQGGWRGDGYSAKFLLIREVE